MNVVRTKAVISMTDWIHYTATEEHPVIVSMSPNICLAW